MNEGMMLQAMTQTAQTGGSWRGLSAVGTVPLGDAFAMLLMELLGVGQEGETEPAAMLAQLQTQTLAQPDAQEDTDTAMEWLAQLYLPAGMTQVPVPVLQEVSQEVTGQAAQAPIQTQVQVQAAQPWQMAEILTAELQPAQTQPQSSRAVPDSSPMTAFQLAQEPETVLVQAPKAAAEAPAMEVFQFQTAVRQAAAELSGKPKALKTEIPDIDALQAAVDQKQFAVAQNGTLEAAEAPTPQPEAEEVIPQLRTGILDNLAAGKDEFVVRLKPEGLGEITVKMVEKEGKVLLRILTSSPQVARALSQDVAALQNTLKPLQAQVQEIAVAESYTAADGQQPGQQNHRPGRQFGGEFRQNRGARTQSQAPGTIPASAAPGITQGSLNAYI